MFARIISSSHCIFCASPCLPTFTVINGKIERIKKEPEPDCDSITPDDTASSSISSLLQAEAEGGIGIDKSSASPLVADQLNSIFILRYILGISEEKLGEFLGKLGGEFNPEYWIQTCTSCAQNVREYYETLKIILRMQKRLKVIATLLKNLILDTRPTNVYSEDVDGIAAQVWKEVREEVLKEFGDISEEPDHLLQDDGGIQSFVSYDEDGTPQPIFINNDLFTIEEVVPDPMPIPDPEPQVSHSIDRNKISRIRKQKLITKPTDLDCPLPPKIPSMIIVENVEEQENQSQSASFILEEVVPSVADDVDQNHSENSFDIEETYHFDLKYGASLKQLNNTNSNSNNSTRPKSSSIQLQNQHNNQSNNQSNFSIIRKKPGPASKTMMNINTNINTTSILISTPKPKPKPILKFRQDLDPDSIRKYPLPTITYAECPRFSGVRKARQMHYECLECGAKSTVWAKFKAHLELHHPSVGAIPCEKCGWFVHPEGGKRHESEYHPV